MIIKNIKDIETIKLRITKPIVAASGYFDILHKGHIEYLNKASELKGITSNLFVIVNNNKQAMLKKEKFFMDENERMIIVDNLRCVPFVLLSVDEDLTVCKTLELLHPDFFVKGGDRFSGEIPESTICKKLGIVIIDGLGEKIQSSSSLIKNYEEFKLGGKK